MADGAGVRAWRRVGAAAVAIAGTALTASCVVSWLVKAEVVDIESFTDPG